MNGPTKISTTDTIITAPPTQLVDSSDLAHPGDEGLRLAPIGTFIDLSLHEGKRP